MKSLSEEWDTHRAENLSLGILYGNYTLLSVFLVFAWFLKYNVSVKKVFGIIMVILIGLAGYLWLTSFGYEDESKESSTFHFRDSVSFRGLEYNVVWIEVESIANMKLLPNFEDSLSPSEIYLQNDCIAVVSAGFYDVDNTPVGLFVYDGSEVSKYQKNRILNGMFYLSNSGKAMITGDEITEDVLIGLQAGPLMVLDGNIQTPTLSVDKRSRRIIMATSNDDRWFFIAVFGEDSVYDGPYLADLPEISVLVEKVMEVEFSDVINLDGGSASTMYTEDLNIPHLSPVGSYFCIK